MTKPTQIEAPGTSPIEVRAYDLRCEFCDGRGCYGECSDPPRCGCGTEPTHHEDDHCSECGALPHVPCHESCKYGAYEEMP